MFKLSTLFKKPTEAIKAVLTADAFGGFFDVFSTSKNPLSLVPVYASIKIISQTISIADLELYQKTTKGRKLLTNHKLTKLFKSPFLDMTYFNWQQMMMLQLAGYGNAYALIVRDINYNVKELIPLEWDMVTVMKDYTSSVYWYQVTHNSKTFSVFPENMLHYKLFSSDGFEGLSPIALHKNTIDSLSAEADYLTSFYEKAANLSGTIESTGVNQKQIDSIKEAFNTKYGGTLNSGKTLILPNGMTYKQLKLLSPMDANYIETAKLNRADVAVIFGIPLALLGDLSQATFSNLSELNRSFYKMTIAPYFKAIAEENNMKLLNESEKDSVYFEFNPEILLAATKKERYEVYAVGIDNGFITRNEVRELENLETLNDLDEMLQKSGVMTIEQANNNFKNSEVKEDETDTKEIENETTDDVTALMIQKIKADKNLSDKDRSDALSHLGRLTGLIKTSAKTSEEKVLK